MLAYKPNIGISEIRTGAALLKTNIMLMTVKNMRSNKFLFSMIIDQGSHQKEQNIELITKQKEIALIGCKTDKKKAARKHLSDRCI